MRTDGCGARRCSWSGRCRLCVFQISREQISHRLIAKQGDTMAEQQPFGDVGLATNPEPRCPCVLLLDVSGSMGEVVSNAGKDLGYTVQQDGKTYNVVSGGVTRIDLLNEGLRAYQNDLMTDSLAAQRVEVSIITFGETVKTVSPFVGAHEFNPPTLTANGETPLGAAILKAVDAVNERKQQYQQNAIHYYQPMIWLITDGEPTDSWQEAAARIKDLEHTKKIAFFAVGVGEANFDILRQIAVRQPLPLKGYSFKEMFRWLSSTQKQVSHSKPGEETRLKLDSPAGWASL